jgi:hypothetical protein
MKHIVTVIILMAATTFGYAQTTNSTTPKCKGVTASKKPCKLNAGADGYCRFHSPSVKRCGFIKKDKQPCRMVLQPGQTRCVYHTNKG